MTSIWENDVDLNVINAMSHNTMLETLDIVVEEVGADYIKASMPVDRRTHQPMGLLHGGASAALSESIGSIAGVLILKDFTKQSIVGVELNINHLRSVKSGRVYSITRPIKIGKRIQVWNTEIFDEQEKLISTSRLTTMIIDNNKSEK